ncbi:hypothetical protein IX51_01215 [uncultured archaeon]|nr:hypothetical protein IX51_01215 [uncultured archaeon]
MGQRDEDKVREAAEQLQESPGKRDQQDARHSEGEMVIIYARVSLQDQKEDLARQVQRLKSISPDPDIISDIRSGMRFDPKGFVRLLNEIEADRASRICIIHKDRLARFGYDLVEKIC